MSRLQQGFSALDFGARTTEDVIIRLSDFAGKNIVLFFCLKLFGPNCTEEACLFRESFKAFEEKNAVIIGVSTDSLETQKRFKREYNLPYYFVSDSDKKISKLYSAIGFLGLDKKRITFVIDKNGKIIKIIRDQNNIIKHIEDSLTVLT